MRRSRSSTRSGSPAPPCRPRAPTYPALGLPESVIEHTIKLYAAEVLQLQHIARSVRAVTQALVDSGR